MINKNLKSENERPRKKFSSLENKVISLKPSQNISEQYGRRNNVEISGIPDSVEQNSVFSNIGVAVMSNDIEACHKIRKNRNNEKKKTFVRFTNRKLTK